jgi:hypothetical protein
MVINYINFQKKKLINPKNSKININNYTRTNKN